MFLKSLDTKLTEIVTFSKEVRVYMSTTMLQMLWWSYTQGTEGAWGRVWSLVLAWEAWSGKPF